MFPRRLISLFLLALTVGCATTQQKITTYQPLPAPPADPKSALTLDQIEPPAILPQARPATQPSEPAPIEALALYAAARDAMLDNRPLSAANLIQQAIVLDPDSFELYRALGEAYLAWLRRPTSRELEAFENALALRPDDMHLQALLGSQYAAAGQNDKALLHLRLAAQLPDYQTDDVTASSVDLLLARILQQEGYDRASLDCYQSLIHRLSNPSLDVESDPELGLLIQQPQSLLAEVGELYEKHGQWNEALEAYQPLADAAPQNFSAQANIVRMLAASGRVNQAISKAADVVMSFDADPESLALLRNIYRQRHIARDVADTLDQLYAQHPGDQALLLALVDVLTDEGELAKAEKLLENSIPPGMPADQRITAKLFDVYHRNKDVAGAARLLVTQLAADPDSLGELEPMWTDLVDPTRPPYLRLTDLQKLQVPPAAEASRLYWVSRLADVWRRDALARTSLQQAVQTGRPFAPAFRQLTLDIWSRPEFDESQKKKQSDDLADLAQQRGDPSLANEVRGLAALSDKQPDIAAGYFARAIGLGDNSPELLFTYAAALRQSHRDAQAEQLLLKLVGDRPRYDDAWNALFNFYLSASGANTAEPDTITQARDVLAKWLAANPGSVQGRIVQAELAAHYGDSALAEALLYKLLADHPDDSNVITALVALARNTGRLDQVIDHLHLEQTRHPANEATTEWLVELYAAEGRLDQAAAVLDATRHAVASDPDQLYQIAHLYEDVDQKSTTEQVLQQVLDLDPTHTAACNDLGYTWADQGVHLKRAEQLIRTAVAAEPDNQSFLDSMGWVLYKQGRYAEAAGFFEKAIGPAALPDPLVLDHFGDVLYRLGESEQAARVWQRSLSGVDQQTDRADLQQLRQHLLVKLDQQKHGTPVDVAPVAVRATGESAEGASIHTGE